MQHEVRSSDVFLKTDLAQLLRALLSTNETLAAAALDNDRVQAYRFGYAAGVRAVAIAIGADDLVQPVMLLRR